MTCWLLSFPSSFYTWTAKPRPTDYVRSQTAFRRVGAPASACCKIEVNMRRSGMSLLWTLWSGPGTTREWRQILDIFTLVADISQSLYATEGTISWGLNLKAYMHVFPEVHRMKVTNTNRHPQRTLTLKRASEKMRRTWSPGGSSIATGQST